MEKEIKSVFRSGNQDEVLSEAFRLTITRKDIQTLNNLNWLNDEVGAETGAGAGLGGNGTGVGGWLQRDPRGERGLEEKVVLGGVELTLNPIRAKNPTNQKQRSRVLKSAWIFKGL